jgi:hypothetical protein
VKALHSESHIPTTAINRSTSKRQVIASSAAAYLFPVWQPRVTASTGGILSVSWPKQQNHGGTRTMTHAFARCVVLSVPVRAFSGKTEASRNPVCAHIGLDGEIHIAHHLLIGIGSSPPTASRACCQEASGELGLHRDVGYFRVATGCCVSITEAATKQVTARGQHLAFRNSIWSRALGKSGGAGLSCSIGRTPVHRPLIDREVHAPLHPRACREAYDET